MMTKHLHHDLDYLKKEIFGIASMVEDSINKALLAVMDRRKDLAEEVIREDDQIDQREVQIEEQCLKVLALHQPVAVDLRFIITVLKVNNDLERMGDLAVNIAERAAFLSTQPQLNAAVDFPAMADGVRAMVRDSLDALTNMDTGLAWKVIAMDDEIDDTNRKMFDVFQELMCEDCGNIERSVQLLSVSRHLERIADLATNIAEDVIYMVDGELIRHRAEDFLAGENE
jgi:phosphate transport system protein